MGHRKHLEHVRRTPARRRRTRLHAYAAALACATVLLGLRAAPAHAQGREIELTLDRMVRIGMEDSYQIRLLEMNIERRRSLLRAQQANLRSRVDMRLSAPDFRTLSDYKWNSDEQRDEIVRTDTRRWQMDLSVRQPVMLLGYPTNGYLSLNNRVYRYRQLGENSDLRYYNRYFAAYEQPLFQPNRMKNDLESAEMDVESAELSYEDDVVDIIDDLADVYLDLFEDAYERVIAERLLENAERMAAVAAGLEAEDSARAIELDQVQVEVANAREQVQRAESSYRLRMENLKQNLRLDPSDSLALDPVITVEPVEVDTDRAIGYALNLTPRLRQFEISRRESEIRLEETAGRNSFRMNLELTYGREMQDPRFDALWERPRNSYTVSVEAYVPIWDWGARRHRIEAQQIALERTDLRLERTQSEIETEVRSEVRNLEEYQQRALNMQQNLELAKRNTEIAFERYASGDIAFVELLQTVSRERDTAGNLLDAYLGYRRALLSLQQMTYYDFQHEMSVLDRFGIEP